MKNCVLIITLFFFKINFTNSQSNNINWFKSNSNNIFTQDLIVKNIYNKNINLKNLEIHSDTVLVFIWCKTCSFCIKCLNYYKTKASTYKILAIGVSKDTTYIKEKEIAEKNQWPFELLFEYNNNVAKYFYNKGYYKQFYSTNPVTFRSFPLMYLFINNKLRFTNPYHEINNLPYKEKWKLIEP